MTTIAELKAWLKRPNHIRRILVEVDGVTTSTGANSTTMYFSNGAYASASTDTPANKIYLPIIIGGVSFSESFTTTGEISVSFGDIELDNRNGGLDNTYTNLIWARRVIRIYLGDPSWTKSDFKLIFKGLVADVTARDRDTLNLVIVDTLQGLATAISETTFTNTDTTTPQYVPLCFGECFNVTPILTNKSTLEYQVHTGSIEDIIEVRDNGAPVAGFTKNLAAGKFTLNQAAYGQITCSVQGDNTGGYSSLIASIIRKIVTNFGPSANRLTVSDIDTTNFTNFDSTYSNRNIGIYINDRQNILDVCNQIAGTTNAKPVFSVGPLASDGDVGKLRLAKLKISTSAVTDAATGQPYSITGSDIEERSITIGEKIPVKAAVKLAYCKNYTIQASGLAQGLPAEHTEFFKNEWLFTPDNTISAVKSNYKLTSEVNQEDTLLVTKTGAVAEAQERLNFWYDSTNNKQRYVYTMTGYPHLFDLQLGDGVALTNRRFGLNATIGTIISISRDWIKGRVDIGVLV
jgi:hypothetical protein